MSFRQEVTRKTLRIKGFIKTEKRKLKEGLLLVHSNIKKDLNTSREKNQKLKNQGPLKTKTTIIDVYERTHKLN